MQESPVDQKPVPITPQKNGTFRNFFQQIPFLRSKLPHELRICIVAKRFPIAGRGDSGYLWPIAKGIAKKGHHVTVITQSTYQRSGEINTDGVRILYVSPDELESTDFSQSVKETFGRLHREQPFHIVHSIDTCGHQIAKFKKDLNISVAFDVGATQMSQLFAIAGMAQESLSSILATSIAVAYKFLRTYYEFDRSLIRAADGIFVMSPHERTILERYYLYPDMSIYSIPYGIEITGSDLKENAAELKSKLQIPLEGKVAVTYSDMTEVRLLTNLLEAFEKVAVKNSSSRLIIIGNGPKFKDIEYEMLNLALGGRVIMTGAVSNQEISEYIAISDAFIQLSSRTTGFEPMILEAMVQKKLVIGSEVSPLSSLIEDGVDGFLVRPADVKAIATLLEDIFSEHVPVKEIGDHAHRKITSLFDTAKMVDETLNSYFNIIKRTHRY
jgi:1,2-diacylglycerol 3-alpha-glucosyltransferase